MIAVCRALRSDVYMPGELVAREGSIGRQIYLVQSGLVRVMLPKHQELVENGGATALSTRSVMLTQQNSTFATDSNACLDKSVGTPLDGKTNSKVGTPLDGKTNSKTESETRLDWHANG
jgi:hypothetical protein